MLEGLPIDRAVDADAGPARQLDLNASRGAAAAECPVVAPEDGRWVTQSASSPSPAASRPLLLRPSPRSNPCRYSCRQANTWFAFTGGGVRPSLPRHRARASPRRAAASARGCVFAAARCAGPMHRWRPLLRRCPSGSTWTLRATCPPRPGSFTARVPHARRPSAGAYDRLASLVFGNKMETADDLKNQLELPEVGNLSQSVGWWWPGAESNHRHADFQF